MFRRIVFLLLLPGLMLTQPAIALSHSHGDEEPAGHGIRPHFHAHRCATSHDRVRHHHGVADGDAQRDAADGDFQPSQSDPLSHHEHDSDATYVNQVDSVVPSRTTISDVLAISQLWVSNGPQAFAAAAAVGPTLQAPDPTHRAPPPGYDCPLYIWQLVILI